MEVECGSRHGIEYVARNLNASRCVAINSDGNLIKKLAQNNTTLKVVYKNSSIESLPELGQNDLGKFDCILAINALGVDNIEQKFQTMKCLLNKNGYICIAECLQNNEINGFEGMLRGCGFNIVKSQNLTKNVLHAIKLDTRKTMTDGYFCESKEYI